MRRTTTLMTTALLALSLAPAIQAQGYQPDDHRDYHRDGHHTVFPDAGHFDRVEAIAHEIDQTASWAYQQFSRNNRRPSPEEYRALRRLRSLSSAAAHFHDEVESDQQDPGHTADDYGWLERAFYSADQSLSQLSPRPYVDRAMDKIFRLMDELGRFYGHRAGYYGTWNHGHYDRDGRDGHDGRDRGYDHDHDHDNGYRPPYHR